VLTDDILRDLSKDSATNIRVKTMRDLSAHLSRLEPVHCLAQLIPFLIRYVPERCGETVVLHPGHVPAGVRRRGATRHFHFPSASDQEPV
jgi:hypothetical protein